MEVVKAKFNIAKGRREGVDKSVLAGTTEVFLVGLQGFGQRLRKSVQSFLVRYEERFEGLHEASLLLCVFLQSAHTVP